MCDKGGGAMDSTVSDGVLLKNFVGTGQSEGFEIVVRRHGATVMRVCSRLLNRREDVEDATQAVFLTLARKAGGLTNRESVAGWLHHTARYASLQILEAEKIRKQHEQEAGRMKDNTLMPEDGERVKPVLDDELDHLPEKYRVALILHHLEGRTKEEVSRILGKSEGTISTWLDRGRGLLRERLVRRGVGVSVAALAGFLSAESASAALPEPFVLSLGNLAAGREISTQATLLSNGIMKALFIAKLKVAAAVVAGAVLLGGGGAVLLQKSLDKNDAAGAPLPAAGGCVLCGFEREEMQRFSGAGYKLGQVIENYEYYSHGKGVPLPAGHDGDFAVFMGRGSRDTQELVLRRAHASQGRYALERNPAQCEMTAGNWDKYLPWLKDEKPKTPVQTERDWLVQRAGEIWRHRSTVREDMGAERGKAGYPEPAYNPDWSGYERLRFEMTIPDAEGVVGVRIEDAGFRRTQLRVFAIPKGKTVTVDMDMAGAAAAAELDLKKILRYRLRLDGLSAKSLIYLDNVRLVASGGEGQGSYPLVTDDRPCEPFARKLIAPPPILKDAAGVVRKTGKVEKLGPVAVTELPGTLPCGPGHLGGFGETYFISAERGAVAYDNDRLAVMFGAGGSKKSKPLPGGIYASASFDGGATWGGLAPGEKDAALLVPGARNTCSGGLCSDESGSLYYTGMLYCDTYSEGSDMFFQEIAFDGRRWIPRPMTLADQTLGKCTGLARVLRLSSGRLWMAFHDKAQPLAKYSDTDGAVWCPAMNPEDKPPRKPFTPKIGDKLPEKILLEQGYPVPGELLVPYKGQTAAFDKWGDAWSIFDGETWGPVQRIEAMPKSPGEGVGGWTYNRAFETYFPDGRIFLAARRGKELLCVNNAGGAWARETVDTGADGDITSYVLTRSGETVFCFYAVKKADTCDIRLRRWAGEWSAVETLHTETEKLNKLAAPVVSPPDYAPVFWDNVAVGDRSWVKFMRIPNP
ncbi:MAG: sigma-70 family RNA polymerase sigma factor [Planctomycetota bacterium]